MHPPVTGTQHHLEHAATRVSVGTVAAVLRSLEVDGVLLVEDFGDDVLPPFGAGITLFPWPNRVRDGRWNHEGTTQQLDLTEPSKGNASHGLLRNTEYAVLSTTGSAIELGATAFPQHGWPFTLRHHVRYRATENGLEVTHTVTNLGTGPAVFAVGAHPYFRLGEEPIADLVVTADLVERVCLDDRLLPVDTEAVDIGGPFDLTAGRRVGDLDLNYAFRVRASGDRVLLAIESAAGARLELWGDDAFRHLQLYTPSDFPRTDGRHGGTGLAFAAEPMTAPPDALNSGIDLTRIEAGGTWTAAWGVRYSG
ncbi:aldose epimerase [Pseudoclavibacter helvolus]|uniref:aldose epimerase family protein n=1 Tax=Pseudoclavibacter helvolus TaxID=255205 RepID=UPI003C74A02A